MKNITDRLDFKETIHKHNISLAELGRLFACLSKGTENIKIIKRNGTEVTYSEKSDGNIKS